VVFSRSTGVEKETLNQGLHFVNPMKRITEYPVSTETVKTKLKLATKDGKPLTVEITYDYKNDANRLPYIYNKFKGQEPEVIEEGWLQSRLKKSANSVTSKRTILEVFQQTEAISLEVEKAFHENVNKEGFIVESVTFGTPEPDANTASAIQNVVDAQQQVEALKIEKQKAELQADKDKIEAEGRAQAQIEEAKGQAESTRLKAKAQADANKELNASLTDNVLKKMELDARAEHGWVTIQGGTPLVETK
jgi:regulator of protease activity HflC (stomatin/prohibitin superfamily)